MKERLSGSSETRGKRSLAAAALLGLLLASCGGHKEEAVKKSPAPAATPVAVVVQAPQRESWATDREAIGTVRARRSVNVSARLMAYVREVRAQIGDTVSAGQTLVILEAADLDVQKRQAEAASREAMSADAEVNSAIDAAKAQRDLAKLTFRRMQELHEKRSISTQEFDEAQAKLKLAEANVAMAESKRKQLEARQAQVAEAVKNVEVQHGYTVVTAPFAGVIMEKRVEPGQLATPGTPLLVIEQSGAYRLEAPLEESLLPLLKRGQSVIVQLDALDKSVTAPIGEIVPSVDPASRTVLVKADLPSIAGLRSGMSGRLRFTAGATEGQTVPATAVRQEGSLQLVWVAEQSIARSRLVTTGERRGDRVQILSGLTAQDLVIQPGAVELRDGARVEVSR